VFPHNQGNNARYVLRDDQSADYTNIA